MRITSLVVSLAWATPAAGEPASHTWVTAGVGLGGGSNRLGPVNAAAFVDAHFWPSDRIGVFVTAQGFGSSENEAEGRHGGGSMFAGGIAVRSEWLKHVDDGWDMPVRVFA